MFIYVDMKSAKAHKLHNLSYLAHQSMLTTLWYDNLIAVWCFYIRLPTSQVAHHEVTRSISTSP